ncbi:CHASE2 domain-containing protein [Rhodobacteraceae bacterium NNCM2]|nr:CHASE2 domain-containing protein [Coraliihabitans acroporae]
MAAPGGWQNTLPQNRARTARYMKPAVSRRVWPLLIAAASGVAALLCLALIGPLSALEAGLGDRIRIALSSPAEGQDTRISLVMIDEATMATLPYRSPVDRGFLASLVDVLHASGARAIGLDILLDQPTEAAKDQRLAEAIRAFPGPVVIAWADARAGMTEAQIAWLDSFLALSGAVPGFANLTTDPDGLVRRQSRRLANTETQGLAAALTGATGPTEGPQDWLIDWRLPGADGAPAFQQTPAHILPLMAANPAILETWFKDRIVLIGADLPQQDRHLTPLSVVAGQTPTAGVVIHANLAAQILDNRAVPQLSPTAQAAIVMVLALLGMLAATGRMNLFLRALVLIALVAAYLGAVIAVARSGGPVLPLTASLLAFGFSAAGTTALDAVLAHRDRRFIREAFSHYLAPELVDHLVARPEALTLGGDRREMTFLFTDIAGFTSMSEEMEPEALSHLLNAYLDGVSEIVMRHRGVIDKFIGDAVVGLFGVPAEDSAHAANAIRCAAEIDRFAEGFRAQNGGGKLGVTRIGVHTGVATVGNFGGAKRFDYTAIGDAMNTAARLEGANKAFGTRVAISGACLDAAGPFLSEDLPVQPIGDIVLKGKSTPIPTVTLNAAASDDWLARYRDAFAQLGASPHSAQNSLLSLGDDPVVRLHLARLAAGETGARIALTEK